MVGHSCKMVIVQMEDWLVGGGSEVGVSTSHIAGTVQPVDVAATSGSECFSLLGSSVGCQQLIVRRERRRRCSVLATSYSEEVEVDWRG